MIEYLKRIISNMRLKRQSKMVKLNHLVVQCEKCNYTFDNMKNIDEYINYKMLESWKVEASHILEQLKSYGYGKLRLNPGALNQFNNLKGNHSSINEVVSKHNASFISNEKCKFGYLFDNIEGRSLDMQQRECIVKNEINNLVIAGAGSGKSTVIVGKVKYLIEKYKYDPEKLLVLSFTRLSAAEMRERLKKETNIDIDVMTFHKLGLNIISSIERTPSLTDVDINEFVNEKFNELTKDANFNNLVNKYFIDYLKPYKSEFEFESIGSYFEYLKDAHIRTLKNEILKSYEEVEIANFMFINNVNYEYEAKYKHDTRDLEHRQYAPDFYLPDYDIYIEHFGIDRKGNVPKFFTGKDGKSAKETYNEGITWKRRKHKEKNTTLIETYSYEKHEGILTENLKLKLEDAGVKMSPMSRDEIWGAIEKLNSNEITCFVKLLNTFITLMKANDFNIQDIRNLNDKTENKNGKLRNSVFIDIVTPLFDAYQTMLEKAGDIDFNDMVNKATEYVLQGKYKCRYKYIIVDEYQDISRTRYNLIKSLRDINDTYLFCVGDDWQSIYRFAGSQVGLFTKFDQLYGYTEKSYIETTYRFNSSLIKLSSTFILKNGSQLKKQLRPCKEDDSSSFEIIYGDAVSKLLISIKGKLDMLPKDSTVAFLGRYNEKIDLMGFRDEEFTHKTNWETKECLIYYSRRRDLKIQFLTVHRSKGLQADYVFILNNSNKTLGFPSQIEDDPILKLISLGDEGYPFAEERRLFYVALTRAKKFVYLIVERKYISEFIREIEEDYGIKDIISEDISCPDCKKGKMVLREGKYSTFYGCTNYPLCKFTLKQ